MRKIKNEILAPAGSIESLYAAVNAGADAVYTGGSKFGARAYADNFDNIELLKAIDYIHLHDRKIYLTVNTLLKNDEIKNDLYNYFLPIYENGLDAVLVQDMGVLKFIRENFPDVEIHASTQMAVTSRYAAQYLKSLGATRVVPARELTLMDLKDIHDNVDIEIESFIHGAMCYCYSGMCLFSSMIGGRSGNRGRCAGPCRQPYEVYKNNTRLNNKSNMYALSLRDMNTLDILPEIIESGVYSLKIEGRMKSPEYVAGTVSIYRKYLDLYNEFGKDNYSIEESDRKNLAGLYSRSGSTSGYYKNYNSKTMVSYNKPAYNSTDNGFVEKINREYTDSIKKINLDAYVSAKKEEKLTITLIDKTSGISVTNKGEEVSKALKRAVTREDIIKHINKTGDSFFEFENIFVENEDDIFVPVSKINELRRDALINMKEAILENTRRIANEKQKNEIKKDKFNDICVKISCQIYTREQFEKVEKSEEIERIYISADLLSNDDIRDLYNRVTKKGKECYIMLPQIFRIRDKDVLELVKDDNYKFSVRNIDELSMIVLNNKKNFVVDSSMYAFNDYAKEFYYSHGAENVCLPFELNYRELVDIADGRDEIVVYGNIPLMVTANCINKDYDNCNKGKNDIVELKDRKNTKFKAACYCKHCTNVIYNSVPLSLIGLHNKLESINTRNYRINLTTETGKDIDEILEKTIKVFYYKNNSVEDLKNYTRGHFNRGVE